MIKKYLLIAVILIILSIAYTGIHEKSFALNEITWTKAVCNDKYFCMDVLIRCSGGRLIGLEPVTGWVFMSSDWEDPREADFKEKIC